MKVEKKFTVTKKQIEFMRADCFEVLFGGAAGGGKSHGQLIDALIFALKYPKSKQLVLRRTYSELEKSLIRAALSLYPKEIFTLNSSTHTGKFKNGSVIDFGYCAAEFDVYQYQSAEYDIIRFDELTHFTESQYIYLISRVRGANGYPKQVKSTTNPGGVGHVWVKKRFVDPSPSSCVFDGDDGLSRIFIPSLLDDNQFLSRGDPDYRRRLLAMPEREKKALLYGDWNIFDGQYFSEFDAKIHIISPFEIPRDWRKYRTIDYGLDRLACLWIAVSPDERAYVYREYCESNLPISVAAAAITSRTPKNEDIYATLAPPDLFSRSQETGKTKAMIFSEHGVNFTKTSNDRECGWLAVKELLCDRGNGPRLKIFSTVRELSRTLPSLLVDKNRPTDCSTEPHDITHAPDALRGFAIFHSRPAVQIQKIASWSADMYEDYVNADSEGKKHLIKKYGEPNKIE